jgi:membrane-associated protein
MDQPRRDALEGLTASLGAWTYLVVPALGFLETGAFVRLLVPGETAVLVGGLVAERGAVALVPLTSPPKAPSQTSPMVSFLIGRRLGRPFLERHGRRLGIGEAQLLRVERFFSRFGGRAVFFARFVGVLRALTPFLAGASGYPLRRFVPFSVAGTFVWATTFSLIGFLFSGTFAVAGSTVTLVLIAVAVTDAVVSVVAGRLARPDRPVKPATGAAA